jgi:hypothetical protein
VAGCCDCGDEPSGSCATGLVSSDVLCFDSLSMKNIKLICGKVSCEI